MLLLSHADAKPAVELLRTPERCYLIWIRCLVESVLTMVGMHHERPIEATTLLRDIVREHPSATRVLDAHRLDWCCGARRTLAESCASAGAPLDAVLSELATIEALGEHEGEPLTALEGARLTDVIAHVLDRHHAFTRAEASRLPALATKVAQRHGAAHPELAAVEELVHGLFDELAPHMLREERVLFPFIASLEAAREAHAPAPRSPFGALGNPIQRMTTEHEGAGRLLEELARVTNGFTTPREACGSWSALYAGLRAHDADLRRHVWIENEILFPRAIELEQRTGH